MYCRLAGSAYGSNFTFNNAGPLTIGALTLAATSASGISFNDGSSGAVSVATSSGALTVQAGAPISGGSVSLKTTDAVAGDIVAGNSPPGAAGWKVGVAPLDRPNGAVSRLLSLRNCAVSTSGDAFQFVEIAGVRYSHIVDPQTGLGLTYRSSVTVVAPEGAIADSLATAICILGPERGLPLLDLHDQTAALIVHASSDGPQVVESKSFATFDAR